VPKQKFFRSFVKILTNPKIWIIILFLVILGLFFYFDLNRFLGLKTLQENQINLQNFIQKNYVLGSLSYIFIYTLIVAFALPGGLIMTLTGGLLFGFVAILFVNIAATLGAIISFLASRYLIGNSLQKKYSKQLEKFNQNLSQNELSYLFFLRLAPVFPFFLVNLLLGATKVKIRNFVVSTSLGTLPATTVYVFAGTALSNIKNLGDILSTEVFLALTGLSLLSLLPILIKIFQKIYKDQNRSQDLFKGF